MKYTEIRKKDKKTYEKPTLRQNDPLTSITFATGGATSGATTGTTSGGTVGEGTGTITGITTGGSTTGNTIPGTGGSPGTVL